ncbi:leucyl aminopeptidase [Candidatus Uhrbacteria bacterium]|nr:leucyl aminopeptidase [Candidatus Uhrbacteria bacterium]
MNITIVKGRLEEQKADLLVVNEFSGVEKTGGATGSVNKALGGLLEKLMKEEQFNGGQRETLLVRTGGVIPGSRVLLVGLGERKDFSLETVREVSAAAYNTAKKLGARRVVSILHGAGAGKLSALLCAKAQTEGVRLAEYEFVKRKKAPEKKTPKVESWTIVSSDAAHVRAGARGVGEGELSAEGTIFARDLVNEPAGQMTPRHLALAAQNIAKVSKGAVRIKVFEAGQIEKMGMGGVAGVGQGSVHPPYFVHLIYKPRGAKKTVAVVGKGITFDSGGLSLKPADYMMTMKCDMAGAAAVLGLFSVLTRVAPKVTVHGIFGACENMPSGNAIRPGDVLKALNGKTMEVLNTDAEGRLTLADSLSYASKLKPDALVDLATLTGACMAALGEEITGVMGNDHKLTGAILQAAAAAGEKMWELPLEKRYKDLIKSEIADVKNIGGKYGGAITAGLFLQEFVDAEIPWVHLDIAGPAFAERPVNAYTRYGGTGAGVTTLIEFLKK